MQTFNLATQGLALIQSNISHLTLNNFRQASLCDQSSLFLLPDEPIKVRLRWTSRVGGLSTA